MSKPGGSDILGSTGEPDTRTKRSLNTLLINLSRAVITLVRDYRGLDNHNILAFATLYPLLRNKLNVVVSLPQDLHLHPNPSSMKNMKIMLPHGENIWGDVITVFDNFPW